MPGAGPGVGAPRAGRDPADEGGDAGAGARPHDAFGRSAGGHGGQRDPAVRGHRARARAVAGGLEGKARTEEGLR